MDRVPVIWHRQCGERWPITPTHRLRISDSGEFGKRQPNVCTDTNRSTNVEFTTISPTIANTMLAGRCSSLSLVLLFIFYVTCSE